MRFGELAGVDPRQEADHAPVQFELFNREWQGVSQQEQRHFFYICIYI